jgi:hypothetical protein
MIGIGIQPVCTVLSAKDGVKTVWSCEGHLHRSNPFVIFESSERFAQRVHRALEAGYASGELRICWWLKANFRDSGGLQWWIEPHEHISRWRYLPVVRRGIDKELRRLATLLHTSTD